jgi:Arc/MetJ-type ribon-helix-helix transcriptional regulator
LKLRLASEVIRDALRLLDSRDRGAAQLNADVEAGLRQLDAGQSRPFDADAVERITQAGRAKPAALKAGGAKAGRIGDGVKL